MKYACLLLLFVGCSTTPKHPTFDRCMTGPVKAKFKDDCRWLNRYTDECIDMRDVWVFQNEHVKFKGWWDDG